MKINGSRVLRRSIPQGSPGRFFSDGAGRFEPKRYRSKHDQFFLENLSDESGDNLRELKKLYEEAASLVEQGKRFEQQEQQQKVYSYFIFSALAAFCIFGPDKKGKLPEGNEASNCSCVSSM